MATQEASPLPSAEVVGRAFVEQYYLILRQSPGLVHRFYQDSSLLSRPDSTGTMTTVTTMQAIDDKIVSLSSGDSIAEIESADAQESYEKGVIVLVTGSLTEKNNARKKFTQTFFLAPQENGYFVLNDVLRYLEDNESSQVRSVTISGRSEDAQASTQTAETEHAHNNLDTELVATVEEEDTDNVAEVCDPSDKDEGSVVEDEIVEPPTRSSETQILTVADSAPVSQEDAPKKSYASIVKVLKSNPTTQFNYTKQRAQPAINNQKSVAPTKPAVAPDASPFSNDNALGSSVNVDDEGHSIYIRNLPFDATPAQLEEVFKKFGPIKQDGVQVRSNKQGFCFGFVEFETSTGKQNALEASSVVIGDRQGVVEEKKTNSRGSGNLGRGRYPSGRGSFRSESFKGGRGGGGGYYGGGRGGYGRGEFRSGGGEYSGGTRGSSSPWVEGETYQRSNYNGTGRDGHRGGGHRGGGHRGGGHRGGGP